MLLLFCFYKFLWFVHLALEVCVHLAQISFLIYFIWMQFPPHVPILKNKIWSCVRNAGPCSIPAEFSTIYNSDLHEFDPARLQWTQLATAIAMPTPAGRCGLGFPAAAGRLFVFGGCTNACKLLPSSLWLNHHDRCLEQCTNLFFTRIFVEDLVYFLYLFFSNMPQLLLIMSFLMFHH